MEHPEAAIESDKHIAETPFYMDVATVSASHWRAPNGAALVSPPFLIKGNQSTTELKSGSSTSAF